MDDLLEVKLYETALMSQCAIRTASEFTSMSEQEELSEVPSRERHRSYVLGAVVFSVVFAEAAINEFYLDLQEQTSRRYALDNSVRTRIAQVWETAKIDKLPVLEKYQTALLLCGRHRFDESAQPFQEVNLLVKLRNVIVHFKPEMSSATDYGKKNLRLVGMFEQRFASNQLAVSGNAYFPDHCLGAGCARWAVNSSYEFVKEFHREVGGIGQLLETSGLPLPLRPRTRF